MKKTPSEHFNAQDTKPEARAPRKTPTFRDKNLRNTDDTKPEIPEPKITPPVQSASSRPIIPPPPPPPQMRITSIKPGPLRPPTPPVHTRRQTPTRVSTNKAKADAWEREELEKIKQRYTRGHSITLHALHINCQFPFFMRCMHLNMLIEMIVRYEKLKETIDSWESKKKAKARRKLEKREVSFTHPFSLLLIEI